MRFDLGAGDAWRLGASITTTRTISRRWSCRRCRWASISSTRGERRALRVVRPLGLILLTLGFVWTGSRGGFIALAAVAIFIVLRYSAMPLRWRLSATALVAAVLLASASDQYWQQMSTITSEDRLQPDTSETGRLQIWSRGIGYMLANPILGLGPGNFQAAEGTLSPHAERQQYGIGVRWNAAHNSFIQVGAELGIPGLILFLGVIATAFGALAPIRPP